MLWHGFVLYRCQRWCADRFVHDFEYFWHVQGLVTDRGNATTAGVDQSTMKSAAHILQEHNKGIKKMQAHMDKIERDIAVVMPN
jgi:hypothetical protein